MTSSFPFTECPPSSGLDIVFILVSDWPFKVDQRSLKLSSPFLGVPDSQRISLGVGKIVGPVYHYKVRSDVILNFLCIGTTLLRLLN